MQAVPTCVRHGERRVAARRRVHSKRWRGESYARVHTDKRTHNRTYTLTRGYHVCVSTSATQLVSAAPPPRDSWPCLLYDL